VAADADMISLMEKHRFTNLQIIDVGAVAAPQIYDRVTIGAAAKQGMPARGQLITLEHDIAGRSPPDRDVAPIQDKFAYFNTWAILGSTVGGGKTMNYQAAPGAGSDGTVGMNPVTSLDSWLGLRPSLRRRCGLDRFRPLPYRCTGGRDSGGGDRGGGATIQRLTA
jgi:hypothetical protein